MINVLYLLKILKTDKLSELVANIDAPVLDFNLAIWEAEKAGQIETDTEKDKIIALMEHEASFDSDLATKLIRVIQHYTSKEMNVTRGRMTNMVKNVGTEFNYPYHEYLMALQYLIDTEQVIEQVVEVPKIGARPYHKFVFLCLGDNPNELWNKNEVNRWLETWNKKK